jgi:hypothetical protein
MDLTRTLRGFVIVILVITVTSKSLDRVDFIIIFMGPLTLKVLTVVTMPSPSFMSVPVVVAMMVTVVESPAIVTVLISPRRVIELLVSSHIFSK